jgi:maltooligosyltrehalose trehalohydrolase
LPPTAFISFLQNHDQVGNRAFGERILKLAPARAVQAAMEILLLAPSPPMLFMGEEFGAVTPFLFFCDFSGDLAAAVTNGRRNEFARFAKFNSPAVRDSIPDPNAEDTLRQSKLDWKCLSVSAHPQWLTFYRELLAMRQRTIVPHLRAKCSVRCEFSGLQGQELSMDWLFDDGARLELRANLRNERVTTTQEHTGVQFYCSGPDVASAFEEGWLPGWSVVWLMSGQWAVPSRR